MSNLFQISSIVSPGDAQCRIIVDQYVPLRFETFERPMGSHSLLLGDGERSLLQILVDPNLGMIRGITLTSFAELSPWPTITVTDHQDGIPALDASLFRERFVVDTAREFSVSIANADVLISWESAARYHGVNFMERVQFLVADGRLSGVEFRGFTKFEIKNLLAHAQHVDL